MKRKSPRKLSTDEMFIYNGTVLRMIKPIVMKVRDIIAETHDVSITGDYPNYSGLCYYASTMVVERIDELNMDRKHPDFVAVTVHGEQKHSPRAYSKYWPKQHEWVEVYVKVLDTYIYIDPTSGQFKHIYDDIPDFYISLNPPKWYYPDRENPAWNGITKKINELIEIPYKLKGDDFIAHEGIIEAFQYRIWGTISDLIWSLISRFKALKKAKNWNISVRP